MSLVALMGKPSRAGAAVKDEDLERLAKLEGGKGSGNFGHAGRPGKVGGSAPGESGAEPREIPDTAKDFQVIADNSTYLPYSQSVEIAAMKFGLEKINDSNTNTMLMDDKTVYNAVYDYMNEAYKAVNGYHRSGKLPSGHTQEYIDDMTDALDEACSNEIGSDIVVYRSMNARDLDIGDEFVDNGYVSTSLDRAIASSFHHGLLARIYVPKRSRGVFLGNIPSEGRQEWEVLLPRQTKFRVLNKSHGRIELEVVNE